MTVKELLKQTTARIKHTDATAIDDIFTAINTVTDTLFRYLWEQQSDLIESSTTLDFAVSEAFKPLPADFYGFAGMPSITVDEVCLVPATRKQAQFLADETGYPDYFEQKNGNIYLYPVTDSAVSLLVDYYTKPVDVTSLDDSLPFAGLFDPIYRDGVIRVQAEGVMLEVDKDFRSLMKQVVARTMKMRDPITQERGIEGCY